MRPHHARHAAAEKTPRGCEECLQTGSSWVHLRLCLSCGHVGCCDSAPNQHASRHFQHTQHPVITSLEADERRAWCFVDEEALEGPDAALPCLR